VVFLSLFPPPPTFMMVDTGTFWESALLSHLTAAVSLPSSL
jgi:hypothetical protein